MPGIVLQKALSAAGVASRRAAEKMILAGRVSVNGRIIKKLGTRVDENRDRVAVGGKEIKRPDQAVYFLLHKPKGVLSTVRDDRGRKTIMDLVPSKERVYPVGRLDAVSSGLMLLTNDGDLAHKLTHPKFEHEKEYEVLIQAPHDWSEDSLKAAIKKFERGVNIIKGFKTSPAQTRIIKRVSNDRWLVGLVIHEGRKHQVRQMINAVGASAVELKRVRMGSIRLGDLPVGQSRALTAQEVENLLSLSSQRRG